MSELQGHLEEKNAGLESLSKDLQLAEQQYQRLLGRMEDLQQTLSSRDTTGEGVKADWGWGAGYAKDRNTKYLT